LEADERRRIVQDCQDLVSALAQLGDRRDDPAGAALFTEDGTWVRGGRPYRGRIEIAESYQRLPASQVTRHVSASCVVTIQDGDHAEGVTYYIAYRHDPGTENAPLPLPLDPPFSLGEWHDRFERTPEGWRISYRETRRVFEIRGGH
jgi:hypothetical protein